MSNLLSLHYWFDPLPGPWLPGVMKIVYIFFVILFFLGLMVLIFRGRLKNDVLSYKLWGKIQGMTMTIGVVGVILVFAREKMVSFIGMPFLLFLNVIGGAVWLVFIVRYVTVEMPKKRAEKKKREEKEKYLK